MDENLIIQLLMLLSILGTILLIAAIIIVDKPQKKKIIQTVIIFAFIWCIFFSVDFIRTKNQQLPIFCPFTLGSSMNDGGSVMYYGLGYKVIRFNQFLTLEERLNFPNYPIGTVSYYYICSWYPSYRTAWEKIGTEAIQYSYEQYQKNK